MINRNLFRNLLPKTSRSESSVAVIVLAAVLVEATSFIQYWYASKGMYQEIQHRAEGELRIKDLEIQKVMVAVETAIGNTAWTVEHNLSQPDSIIFATRQIVKKNETIVGIGVAFKPNYYPEKGRWFEPYVVERNDGTIEERQIGNAQHDYFQASWYLDGLSAGKGHWSEPYFDESGAKMMLCTYTLPIHDAAGEIVAILGADVSLNWLSNVINAHHIFPSSYNVMISRTGQLMAYPVESLVMRRNVLDITSRLDDTTSNFVNRQMMMGKSGRATIKDENGQKNYIFYAPIEGQTGWSMAVVCSDHEIFHTLRQVTLNLHVMMLIGLGLMVYIVWRTIRNTKRLDKARAQKSAIDSELRIASGIQMALLPKIFPPYPERNDVDLHASLVPAREVGGDLFDFYIRDEKLFFCIGDVSGKGVPASLVMSITRTLFRIISAHQSHPGTIVSQLNDAMTPENDSNMFVTLFVGVLDLPTGRLRYCNAGHNAPYLISADGSRIGVLPVDSNLPAGIMSGWAFTMQESMIDAGSTIFLYTDGISEAENNKHAQFGEERIIETIRKASPVSSAVSLINQMTEAVHVFVAGAEQSDDLTMMAIRYTLRQQDVRLKRSITLPNDIQKIPHLTDFVDGICESLNLDMSMTMNMNLALEEAVVNVMNYAYPSKIQGTVNVEAIASDDWLDFVITDNGIPFDPTAKEDANTTLSIEERPIGGLGIHLVRNLMDSINYERTDNKNVLTLRKKLS